MDFSSSTILTSILNIFRDASVGGAIHLIPHARSLLLLLGVINICTTWTLYEGQLRISQMISQIMKISFFLFLIINWVNLNGMLMNSFKIAGFVAAGIDPNTPATNVMDPSSIMDKGIDVVNSLLKAMAKVGFNFGTAFLYFLAIILVIFAFAVMAFQLMITIIEFNIFAGIAVILMPFGAIRYTQFLFQRCISAVFAFGVKLMLMFFLLGIVVNFTKDPAAIASNQEFSAILTQAIAYVILGFIVWKVPNMAAMMIQGMPSMDASGPMQYIGAKAGHQAMRPVRWGANKLSEKTVLAAKAGAALAVAGAAAAAASQTGQKVISYANLAMGAPNRMPSSTTSSRPSREQFNNNVSSSIRSASAPRPQSSDSNRFS